MLVITACSGGTGSAGVDTENNSSDTDQVLTFGFSDDPPQPVTGMAQGAAMNQLLPMVHRGLLEFDTDGTVVEALAESVEQPDNTTYVFTLREGLTFNDGSELTADNVKNSLDYVRDPDNGTYLAGVLTDIESVETDSDREVTVTLSSPNNAILEILASPFASIVPDESLNSESANWVGAGPFSMENLEQGVGLTMEKYDGFYDSDSVDLDAIEVRFYPDGDARVNALLSGDVDMIDHVTWENFDRVKDSGFTVDSEYGPFQYVQFNVDDTPFSDPLVRQAVAYALNRENSVMAGFYGNAQPLYGLSILESDAAYDENLENLWEYDPDRARELLDEAGYPDGFDVTLLSTSHYSFLQSLALSVQEDLAAVGINATLDTPDLPSRITQGDQGDYDLAVSGDSGVVADPSYLRDWVRGPDSFNMSYGYVNDEINDLIAEGLRATDDEGKHAIYQEIGELWREDVPFASLNVRDQAYAYSDEVEGFATLPEGLVFFSGYNLTDVSIN